MNPVAVELSMSSVITLLHQFLLETNLVAAARSLELESGVKVTDNSLNEVSSCVFSSTGLETGACRPLHAVAITSLLLCRTYASFAIWFLMEDGRIWRICVHR